MVPSCERDVPAPALGVGRREDVVPQLSLHPPGAGEVAPDGQVLEEGIELAQAVAAAEQRLLAAGVYDVTRLDDRLASVRGAGAHAERAEAADRLYRRFLEHFRALARGMAKQERVELRAHDVERVRIAAGILAEPEAPRALAGAPEKRAPGLLDEAVTLDLAEHADVREDR